MPGTQYMNPEPVMLNGQMHPPNTLSFDVRSGQWQQPLAPGMQASMLGSFNPQVTQQAQGLPAQVAGAAPSRVEQSWANPAPAEPAAAAGAAAGAEGSMFKNPDFWNAAATAAGPILGALLAPTPAPNVPTMSNSVAGGAAQSQMQGPAMGMIPTDPRTIRPFG